MKLMIPFSIVASVAWAQPKPLPVDWFGAPDIVSWESLAAGVKQQVWSTSVNKVKAGVAVRSTLGITPVKEIELAPFASGEIILKAGSAVQRPSPGQYPIRVILYEGDFRSQRDLTLAVPEAWNGKLAVPDLAGTMTASEKSCIPIPLTVALPADSTPDPVHLKNSLGGFGQANFENKEGQLNLCLKDAAPGVYSGEPAVFLIGREIGKQKLSITVQHHFLCAFTTILLGVLVAWFVKRGLNVRRTILLFRRRAAEVPARFETVSAPAFVQAAGADPRLRIFQLVPAFRDRWNTTDRAIQALSSPLATKLDETSEAFKGVSEQIRKLETIADEWPKFGRTMAKVFSLQRQISTIQANQTIFPASVATPEMDKVLTARAAATMIDDVVLSRTGADGEAAAAGEWLGSHSRLASLFREWAGIDLTNAADDQKVRHRSIKETILDTRTRLWATNDAAQITVLDAAIVDAASKIVVLAAELGVTASDPGGGRTVQMETTSPSAEPSAILRSVNVQLEATEWGLVVAALILAVLGGLSTNYFGQPFGTVKSYIDLFLWGAGTKAGVDLVTATFEQFGGALRLAPKS